MRFLNTVLAAVALVVSVASVRADNFGIIEQVGQMVVARSDADAETIGEVIYVTGGCDGEQICQTVELSFTTVCSCDSVTDLIEAYFPGNNTWSSSALPPMPTARFRHSSIHFGNLLYVFGGRDVNDTLLHSIDILDLVNNTWSTVSPSDELKPLIGSDNSYWTVGSNAFAFAGGYDQNYTVLNSTVIVAVDPNNATNIVWTAGPVLPLPVGDFSSAPLDSTHTLIMGGFIQEDFCHPRTSTFVFDASDSNVSNWRYTAGPSMPLPGADQAVSLFESNIYVFGGQRKDSECHTNNDMGSSNVISYLLDEGAWQIDDSLPIDLFRFASAPYTDSNGNQFLYVLGGQTDPVTNTTANVRYNPISNVVYRFIPANVRAVNGAAVVTTTMPACLILSLAATVVASLLSM